MKIIDIINSEKPTLSMEVFPPKTTDSFESVRIATEKIAVLSPDFMSVTYGAGGGTSQFTAEIAGNIQDSMTFPFLLIFPVFPQPRQKSDNSWSFLNQRELKIFLL